MSAYTHNMAIEDELLKLIRFRVADLKDLLASGAGVTTLEQMLALRARIAELHEFADLIDEAKKIVNERT